MIIRQLVMAILLCSTACDEIPPAIDGDYCGKTFLLNYRNRTVDCFAQDIEFARQIDLHNERYKRQCLILKAPQK